MTMQIRMHALAMLDQLREGVAISADEHEACCDSDGRKFSGKGDAA